MKYIEILKFIWRNAERDYLKSISKNKGGMKYEKTPVKKGK